VTLVFGFFEPAILGVKVCAAKYAYVPIFMYFRALLSKISSMSGNLHTVFRRALIADDNQYVRMLVHWYLEQECGVRVCVETANGPDTVNAALSHRPDLLILDMSMPGLNGIEVSSILRPSLPASNVILFTLYREYVGNNVALAAGVHKIVPTLDGLSSLKQAMESLSGEDDHTPRY
jgi:DNA-binding NarL/FixJ family response regulator